MYQLVHTVEETKDAKETALPLAEGEVEEE